MVDPRKIVEKEVSGAIKGSDLSCSYYPCHYQGQDCTFCYCPLYPCLDASLGEFVESRKGGEVWSCAKCFWVHRPEVASSMHSELRADPGLMAEELKPRLEKRFRKRARAVMILGATSGAGKSLIAAGLCRLLSDRGCKVAPFKSQNMSLNSFVTKRGEEIARIQELQARAARVEPIAAMNPILLKPKGNAVSQVIVEGRPLRDMDVAEYYGDFARQEGLPIIRRNFELLARTSDFVVIEGAGSPAEINLGDLEIANMPTAEIADADCVLVVNIEWGGAFAYIFGTILLMKEEERKRFKGVIINNMHGDAESLATGIERVEEELGVAVLGTMPHLDLVLPTEDSMFIASKRAGQSSVVVGVIRLPRISNFTDFDALALDEDLSVLYLTDPQDLDFVNAVIIPGTKNTVEDLLWLREKGLFDKIRSLSHKVPILGVCGGFQMLGERILDPFGIEGGVSREVEGLGLLRAVTTFDSFEKRTVQAEGRLLDGGGRVRGYEIHMGRTDSDERRLLQIEGDEPHQEGAIDDEGMVMGTYLHGVLDLPSFREFFLAKARGTSIAPGVRKDIDAAIEESIARMAEAMDEHLDLSRLLGDGLWRGAK